jgi:acyl transferase domain-containing protein
MTGTAAGDPVEAEAIARTFGKCREAHDPVVVGSVKTNLGHIGPVSGLAALIKTTFALKNRLIPPSLNYEKTNPEIDLEAWHLKVPTISVPWPQGKLLRASVNNLGYGGTNAHAILEPAPASIAKTSGLNKHVDGLNGIHISGAHGNGIRNGIHNGEGHANADRSHVFILSAKDLVACQTMMGRFAAHVATTMPSASDLAYTLAHP